MKKIITLFLIVFGCFGLSFASTCKEFSAGKVCLSLENNGNGKYEVKKDVEVYSDKNMLMLNCDVLTPNDKLKDIGTCDGSFTYNGNGVSKVSYITYLEGEKERLEEYYKFNNISSENMESIKAVYNMWSNLTSKLEEKYPSLKNHNTWQKLSETIYNQIDKLISVKSNYINTYDRFERIIKLYVKYTTQLKNKF